MKSDGAEIRPATLPKTAVENLPVAFPGRLAADILTGLRRDRCAVETPEAAKAVESAEHIR